MDIIVEAKIAALPNVETRKNPNPNEEQLAQALDITLIHELGKRSSA